MLYRLDDHRLGNAVSHELRGVIGFRLGRTRQFACRLVVCVFIAMIAAPQTLVAVQQPNSIDRSAGDLHLQVASDAIVIRWRDQSILEYRLKPLEVPVGIDERVARSGILHPVRSVSGREVTAAYPFDHPHQSGIFSAWVQTQWNGRSIDYWNLIKGEGRVLHERVVLTFSEAEQVGYEVELLHRIEQAPKVDVLRERWRVTVFQVSDSVVEFDLETEQTALTEFPFKVLKYHYGGVAVRGPTQWLAHEDTDLRAASTKPNDSDDALTNPSNQAPNRATDHWEPGDLDNEFQSGRVLGNHQETRWVVMSGTVEGESVALSMLAHAENFCAPQPARLHPTKPYFVYAPCVTDEFVIDLRHPYRARYKFLITESKPTNQWLEERWNRWHDQRD